MLKLKQLCTIAVIAVSATSSVAQISKTDALSATKLFAKTEALVKGHFYGSAIIRELLAPSSVEGTIIFKGKAGDGIEHIYFKRYSKDFVIANPMYTVDDGEPCAPFCSPPIKGNKVNDGLAQQAIAQYQEANGNSAQYFNKADLVDLLNQSETGAIYFTSAIVENKLTLLAVGATSNGDIMWSGKIVSATNLEMAYPNGLTTSK